MCFTIQVKRGTDAMYCKATKAEKDIVVYKWLKESEGGVLCSPIKQGTKWKKGVPKIAGMCRKSSSLDINKGLHSFRGVTSACRYRGAKSGGIYKCKIPKGAYFFVNRTQYVSNRLILTRITKSV